MEPNHKAIGDFMQDSLSNQEIQDICFYYFRDLYEELDNDSLKKSVRIREVLAYVRRRQMMTHLVAALYERHGAQMTETFPHGLGEKSLPAVPVPHANYARDPRQIFISHAHQDSEFAHKLADDLELEGWHCWLAPDSILPGEQWAGAIERGLATSSVFLLVLSPESVASRWVRTETNVALELEHEGQMQIVPLLLRPCQVPLLWRAYQNLRFTRGSYPLDKLLQQLNDQTLAPPFRITVVSPPKPSPVILSPQPEPKPSLVTPLSFDGIEWIEIPAGEFWMGDDDSKYDEEKPCHRLHLDGFWIMKTPVTNAQWRTFVQATGYKTPKYWSDGQIPAEKERHPVVEVNWHDAREYCHWLAAQIGLDVTLPSEAQWEKAARGSGDKRRYPWGNEFNKYKANISESGIGTTTPVDQYPAGASPYGVLDMSGNVWEWTRSIFDQERFPYPYRVEGDREKLDAEGGRVLRGGSWYYNRVDARVSLRLRYNPFYSDYSIGFRAVAPIVLRAGF